MPQKVVRKDYAWEPLQLPVKTGAGLMKVEGYLTSSGVFAYEQADGTVLREWRPPGEVADATAIDSLKLAPITIGHPDTPVTIDNVKELRVGTVGDDVRVETQWPEPGVEAKGEPAVKVRCRMVLDSKDAIAVIEAKEFAEVSCGYSADLDMTPGLTPDGVSYDAVQRRIIYNHLAIGVIGRHGPGVSIRVDGRRATRNDHDDKKGPPMEKLILDGVSYDAPRQTIEAVQAHQRKAEQRLADAVDALGKKDAEVVALNTKLAEADARADAADKAVKEAKKEAERLQSLVREGVRARKDLERAAEKVMGAEAFETAGLADADDDDVRLAVVKHVNPDLDLSAKVAAAKKGDAGAAAYIQSRFDTVVESIGHGDSVDDDDGDDDDDKAAAKPEKKDGTAGSLRKVTATGARADSAEDAADKARNDHVARRSGSWQPKSA
jgi:hypothetical protein